MPGARPHGFRRGDRSELLAETVLNALAFTVRVPRQEDVGHDFLCFLSEKKGQMIWAGPSFTVQVKSKREPLVFNKEHEIAWVKKLDNPFFLAVSDIKNQKVDIYSTWKRLLGFLSWGCDVIHLIPGDQDAAFEGVHTDRDKSEQQIPLDRPILSVAFSEARDEGRMSYLGEVLRGWITLDRENIVRARASMYWVTGRTDYETNAPIDGRKAITHFFWNPNNLPDCVRNFGRSATALRTVIHAAYSQEEQKREKISELLGDLDRVLRSHVSMLEPLAVDVLNNYVGLDLQPPNEGGSEIEAAPNAG